MRSSLDPRVVGWKINFNIPQKIMVCLHAGLSGAPEGRNRLCSPNAERGALRSSNFQPINFFFALLAGYYCTLLYRDTRPLLASPPPPPLPQHATAVTPESFADVVRVCCTPPHTRPFARSSARRCHLRCRPFAYRAAVIHRGRCSQGRQIPLSLNHVRSGQDNVWSREVIRMTLAGPPDLTDAATW